MSAPSVMRSDFHLSHKDITQTADGWQWFDTDTDAEAVLAAGSLRSQAIEALMALPKTDRAQLVADVLADRVEAINAADMASVAQAEVLRTPA